VHGKLLLQQQQLLRACVRAWVAACVIETIYELTRRRRPGRGLPPELALLSVSILLEYFYTEIRFSTPTLSALLSSAGQIYLSLKYLILLRPNPRIDSRPDSLITEEI
jgi:hypothetical protein